MAIQAHSLKNHAKDPQMRDLGDALTWSLTQAICWGTGLACAQWVPDGIENRHHRILSSMDHATHHKVVFLIWSIDEVVPTALNQHVGFAGECEEVRTKK